MLECDIWIKHTTIENDYAIVIAMLSDWLKTLPGFQPMRSKAKTNRTLYALWAIQLQVIARNFDWFLALFAPVVIGRSNYFCDSHLKKVMDF